MAIKILTDSGCDLPEEIIKEYDIEVLPIIVTKDETEYLDGIDITPKEVYDGMKAGAVYKTSQISAISFHEKFTEYANNKESAIYIGLSSGISGTYQSSVLVHQEIKGMYPELDLEVVDSKAASLGFGFIVYEAARYAKAGKTKEEILERIDYCIKNIQQIFTVDDLEYLFRGGRVSKTSAVVGGLLNIKPILEVTKDGKLVPIEKVRGRSKVFKRMIEIMKERGYSKDPTSLTITLSHGDDIEAANKVKELIEEEFGPKEFVINYVGSAIGSHSGPGTIALFFLP